MPLHMKRNPPWTRDELILALDLYFRAGRRQLRPVELEVIQLSQLLNRLPFHARENRGADFRNPQGVSMKLANFLAIDPTYSGIGLQQVSKLDREIWNDFADSEERLTRTAAAIAKTVNHIAESGPVYFDELVYDDVDFAEGKVLTSLHKKKERSQRAVNEKKQQVLKATGKLLCEVCGFDFVQVYGGLGEGFAECHHTVPMSELGMTSRTRLSDLAILCANCHRMIHRGRPHMLSLSELRDLINENQAHR